MSAHYVYIMGEMIGEDAEHFPVMTPNIKIGTARDPGKRLKSIQTGNPCEILCLHVGVFNSREEAVAAERRAHSKLAAFRLVGEWFKVDLEVAVATLNGGR